MKLRSVLIALLVAVFAFGLTQNTFAQGSRYNYSHTISANPILLAFSILNVTYEHQVSPINSFTIFGQYFSVVDWAAYGVGGSYRWYPKLFDDGKRALEGFGVGPAAALSFWSWEGYTGYTDYGGTLFEIGGEASYKWVWGGFALEPIVRLMIPVTKITGYSAGAFGAGVNLGYAW
jgi:hypothetical protein